MAHDIARHQSKSFSSPLALWMASYLSGLGLRPLNPSPSAWNLGHGFKSTRGPLPSPLTWRGSQKKVKSGSVSADMKWAPRTLSSQLHFQNSLPLPSLFPISSPSHSFLSPSFLALLLSKIARRSDYFWQGTSLKQRMRATKRPPTQLTARVGRYQSMPKLIGASTHGGRRRPL